MAEPNDTEARELVVDIGGQRWTGLNRGRGTWWAGPHDVPPAVLLDEIVRLRERCAALETTIEQLRASLSAARAEAGWP